MARLIDAEKLDEDLCEILRKAEYDNNCDTFYRFVSEMNDCINDQPTVDAVEVVHGEWNKEVDTADCEYIECSVCGSMFYDVDNDTFDNPYNYCPNCGADMRG